MSNDYFSETLINKDFKYTNGVYNFLDETSHYTDSFALEYKKYSKIQFDGYNNLEISKKRFYDGTNWKKEETKNKNFLEVGSGGGRFTEIILKTSTNLFTFDSSDAIYENFKNNVDKVKNPKTYFIKCDIDNLPFKSAIFDYIFCFGVIQNTKKPLKNIDILLSFLKKGGKLSCDVTKGNNFYLHLLNPKYFWRNFTTKTDKEKLFKFINFYVRKFYPIDTFLKKKFFFPGKILSKLIFPFPLLNYHYLDLDDNLKLDWSVLDTFDCLASEYDNPLNSRTIEKYLAKLRNTNKEIKKTQLIEKDNFIINIEK